LYKKLHTEFNKFKSPKNINSVLFSLITPGQIDL